MHRPIVFGRSPRCVGSWLQKYSALTHFRVLPKQWRQQRPVRLALQPAHRNPRPTQRCRVPARPRRRPSQLRACVTPMPGGARHTPRLPRGWRPTPRSTRRHAPAPATTTPTRPAQVPTRSRQAPAARHRRRALWRQPSRDPTSKARRDRTWQQGADPARVRARHRCRDTTRPSAASCTSSATSRATSPSSASVAIGPRQRAPRPVWSHQTVDA